MNYALIINNVPVIGTLQQLFPETGFAHNYADDAWLTERNVLKVVEHQDFDSDTHRFVICEPYVRDGKVYTFSLVELTDEEKEIYRVSKLEAQWANIRLERNQRLLDCDWTQLPDSPVNQYAWAEYRQQLRNITTQPDPFNIDWPVKP